MKTGNAILTTLGIFIVIVIAGTFNPAISWGIVLVTALWAGYDAARINLSKYKVGGTTGPVMTVIGCLLLWIVVFPWYLVNRGKILRGEAVLKTK